MIDFDTRQLTALVRNEIPLEAFKIDAIQVGKHYDCIDFYQINDIYIEDPAVEGYNFDNSNHTIHERFARLNELDGHVHLAGGLSCSVTDQRINSIRISKRYIEPVTHFSREQIIEFHGVPEIELIDDYMHSGFDYTVDNYILVYNTKNLNFYIDPETNLLREIYTGVLDLKYFTNRSEY